VTFAHSVAVTNSKLLRRHFHYLQISMCRARDRIRFSSLFCAEISCSIACTGFSTGVTACAPVGASSLVSVLARTRTQPPTLREFSDWDMAMLHCSCDTNSPSVLSIVFVAHCGITILPDRSSFACASARSL
jgi:hypothetical protein